MMDDDGWVLYQEKHVQQLATYCFDHFIIARMPYILNNIATTSPRRRQSLFRTKVIFLMLCHNEICAL